MAMKKFIDLTVQETADLSQIGTRYIMPTTCLHNAYRVASKELKGCTETICFYASCPIHNFIFMSELSTRFSEKMAKPKREKAINRGDIINLKVELYRTDTSFEQFLERT